MNRVISHAAAGWVLMMCLTGCSGLGAADEIAQVRGTATYRDRMLLPPDATLEITVEDVSRADAPAKVLG